MASTREAPSLNTYNRILDGTAAAATDKGLRACTVQDILGNAGVSRRTFYQYFSSKDDAFRGLYESYTVRLVAAMYAAADETEGEVPKIIAVLNTFLDFQVEGGELLMQLHAEAIRPESELLPVREEVLDRIVDLLDLNVGNALNIRLDKMVYRSLVLGIEGLCIHIERQGHFNKADAEEVRRIAQPLMVAVLSNHQHLPKRE